MIRGRYALAGHPNLNGVSLAAFCDVVWMEILSDCSPMGDRNQYQRIVRELFLEGKDPFEIWIDSHDKKGKPIRKRLSDTPATSGAPVARDALAEGRALRDAAIAAAKAAREKQAGQTVDE